MTFSYGSVCSGIEAATVAWHPLGARAAWFAEIEAFPAAVLAHHYPAVPNLGDMTQIAQWVRLGLVEAPDVLVGGTPCQAFSVAGLRAGLADPRGQLSLSYVDLANAIDEKRPGAECTVVWENVPGVLSDKSNAFGCFLGYLAGEDDALVPPGKSWPNAGVVYGPQRAIAWRVLDAQYFGVAQRRRRVFVVASARAGFDPAAILFELEGVRRDTPPSREAGQEITGTLASRTSGGGGGGGLGTDFECMGGLQVAKTLLGGGNSANPLDEQLVVMAHGQSGAEVSVGQRPTLTCNHEAPILAFNANAQADQMRFDPHAAAAALTCSQSSAVAYAHVETMPTMRAGNPNGGAVPGARSGDTKNEYIVPVMPTMAFAQNSRDEIRLLGGDGEIAGALAAQPGMKQTTYVAPGGMRVRRLVPHECERLQAFGDQYTLIPIYKGKKRRKTLAADGPRYKALGNSMCVFVMRWIGKRLIY